MELAQIEGVRPYDPSRKSIIDQEAVRVVLHV